LATQLQNANIHQEQDGDSGPSLQKTARPNNTVEEVGVALPIENWEQSTPAVHLSPTEWNEKLLKLSQEKNNTSSDGDVAQAHSLIGEDAILLDTRNVYETRVGHFGVPNLDTFFPNTRKFSSLPNALNTEEAANALAGKQVFMYCTGGVRCERAGSYLRALSESNSGAWKGKERPKGIFQLQGGIQKYLEEYGTEGSKGDGYESNSTTNSEAAKTCLYRGKNFVFDPRRTDPIIGNGSTGGGSQSISLVGRCIICSCPHDDYDNGHAPCEEKEARCCRCRVLVLVCNDCRTKVRSWGEASPGDDDENKEVHSTTDLFCGKGGSECIDEGNIAEMVETLRME